LILSYFLYLLEKSWIKHTETQNILFIYSQFITVEPFHPSEASQVFPPELSFFDRKTSEALGMHHLQATFTMFLWMWFLNVRDNVPMDLKYVCQQYWTTLQEDLYDVILYIYCMLVREIWKCIHSWVNKFSYFLNPHAINVLLYRMKPRKHIHVKYCWQTYFKSISLTSMQ
jgi:hypothetical protein